jgi:hypothetical protein
MNTTMKTLLIALGLGFSATAQEAADYVAILEKPGYIAKVMAVENTTEMNVYIANKMNHRLEFKLKNAAGEEIYSQIIAKNKPQARLKLNMNKLPNGYYEVEMSDKYSKSVKLFRKGVEVVAAWPVETLIAINY